MKTLISIIVLAFLTLGQTFAQVPAAFSYQAIPRDASGSPIANTNISVRLTIEQDEKECVNYVNVIKNCVKL